MSDPSISLAEMMPARDARSKRRWWPALVTAGVVATLGLGVGSYLVLREQPGRLDVSGVLELKDDNPAAFVGLSCEGDGGYQDIARGAQVTVTDKAGAVLGVGALETGKILSSSVCGFPFTVTGVATGSAFYGIEVAHRDVVWFSEEQVRQPLTLSLG